MFLNTRFVLLSIKYLLLICFLCASIIVKADEYNSDSVSTGNIENVQFHSLDDYFKKGSFNVHARTYFMNTINEGSLKDDYALAAGAGIGCRSAPLHGLGFGISGFFIIDVASSKLEERDPITNQMNRYELALFDLIHPENKSVLNRLEEGYVYYKHKWIDIHLGRIYLNTPFINAQDGRMCPSLEQGAWIKLTPHKLISIEGGWLRAFSPRGTVLWYNAGSSIGIFPVGVNTLGEKSGYGGNTNTKGVGVFNLKAQPKNMEIDFWNYTIQNVSNTAFLQTFYNFKISSKSKIRLGIQAVKQDKIKLGGNHNIAEAYYEGKGTIVVSSRIEFNSVHNIINFNYARFSSEGRFLFPREWGRDPFFTFIPRERNEGAGGIHAFSMNYMHFFKTQGLIAGISSGIYQMPDVKNYRLNKYGLGDYVHLNTNIKYEFQHKLRGLDVMVQLISKLNIDEQDLPEKHIYNRVNLFHTNVIINYYFNHSAQH